MAKQWTFDGEANPGQIVTAYDSAGRELGRWLVRESGTVDAEVEADDQPEWRVENQPPEVMRGSPA